MPTVLIIAYYYSPAAVVGTHRIVRFVKYLPEFGWNSIILTVDASAYDIVDYEVNSNATNNNNCIVYRTAAPNPHKVQRQYKLTKHGGLAEVGVKHKNKKRGPIARLLRYYTAIPDTRIGWLPMAVLKGLSIIKRHKIDVIISTSYPYTSHLIGSILKRLTSKPWIADFRDPWAEYAFLYPNTTFHRMVAEIFESNVVENANYIITNTLEAQNRFRQRYPTNAAKITSITNGFDKEDFTSIDEALFKEYSISEDFTIVHSGTLYPEEDRRHPKSFLQALSELFQDVPTLKEKIKVRFIGHIHFKVNLSYWINYFDLDSNIEVVGYVSHNQCVQELISAQLLLLIHHTAEPLPFLHSTIPAKTYEYLGAKKPILCLSSHYLIKDLIERLDRGICVEPTNIESIKDVLTDLYNNYTTWSTRINNNHGIEQYEARSLTNQLSSVLDECVRESSNTSRYTQSTGGTSI